MKATSNKPQQPTHSISNCTVINQVPAANEHTRAAVEALANAAARNAEAISEIAKALNGGNATMENGIRLGGD